MDRQTISLVIIALNEEKNIRRVIERHKKYFNEVLIALDSRTSVSDKTWQIANDAGVIPTVFYWADSFSDFRNEAALQAKGDWIFMLDCDEECTQDLLDNLQKMVNQTNIDGYLFPRKNVYTTPPENYPDLQLRLYRRKYKWTGRVHEVIDKQIPQNKISRSIFHIIHHKQGKTTEQIGEQQEKYRRLLKMEARKENE